MGDAPAGRRLRFQAAPATEGLVALAGRPRRRSRAAAARGRRRHPFPHGRAAVRPGSPERAQLRGGGASVSPEFGQAQSALEHARAARSIADTPLARREPARDPALGERRRRRRTRRSSCARASAAFRRAIRAAPNDDAKINLEVLLTLLQPTGERRRDAPSVAGPGAARAPGSPRREAGTDAGRLADARGGARRSRRRRARRGVAPRRAARAARAVRPSPRAADRRHLVGSAPQSSPRSRSWPSPQRSRCLRPAGGRATCERGGVRRPRHVGVDARRAADALQPCGLPRPSGSRTRSRARRSASRR